MCKFLYKVWRGDEQYNASFLAYLAYATIGKLKRGYIYKDCMTNCFISEKLSSKDILQQLIWGRFIMLHTVYFSISKCARTCTRRAPSSGPTTPASPTPSPGTQSISSRENSKSTTVDTYNVNWTKKTFDIALNFNCTLYMNEYDFLMFKLVAPLCLFNCVWSDRVVYKLTSICLKWLALSAF